MSDLHALQNQLLSDIFDRTPGSRFDPRGLTVYRNNLRATAVRALSITFPTLFQLLGDEAFTAVTEKLLEFEPPSSGDWAVWGQKLPELLTRLPELSDYPFLSDCATLDYHCHQMVRHPFTTADFTSLVLMESYQPEELMVEFNPTLLLMKSAYPIAEIRRAHVQQDPSTQQLKNAFDNSNGEHYVAAFLNNAQVQVSTLNNIEFAWITTLQTTTLGKALTAFNGKQLSFESWLIEAIQTNLLHRVRFNSHREEH